jgi:hypothetical protein
MNFYRNNRIRFTDHNCYPAATKVVLLPIRSQRRYYKTLFSSYLKNETASVAYRYDPLFSTLFNTGDNESIYVNDVFSGGQTGTTKFTAYISPYLGLMWGGDWKDFFDPAHIEYNIIRQ